MTFPELVESLRDSGLEGYELAEHVWEAATKEAVRRVAETSKRYTCDKMLGVCKAIIYELQREGK